MCTSLRKLTPLALPIACWLCVGVGRVSGQAPRGDQLPVREITLDNGMRFLVLPQRGAPTVSFVTQYAVGGVNENLGTTGIAHLLEHLLFKGTTTVGTRDHDAELKWFARMDAAHDSLLVARGRRDADSTAVPALESEIKAMEDSARALVVPNEFDEILARNGARGLNATTTNESTIYYVDLPANRAELWFVLEADRIANPVFREFYTERDVVMEERLQRVDTSPGGLLYEAHLAAAYQAHPYGVPVIGWRSDVRAHTRHEVEDYYHRYYGPRNAVVAIVGDVDPDQVESWARKYFSKIPPGESPPPVTVEEPEQRGERRVEVHFDAEPAVRIGWHVVDESDPDHPALVMLTSLLTGGRTSRLYKKLVLEDRIATYLGAGLGPGDRYPALFSIDAYPRSPHTTAELEQAVYVELDRLASEPPAEIELQRVRNQLEAGTVRRLESNFGLAVQLAGSESLFGDWRTTFHLEERLEAVTPADIQRVARKYFRASNRTVATLVKPAPAGDPR